MKICILKNGHYRSFDKNLETQSFATISIFIKK